jgi:hypothetical protein
MDQWFNDSSGLSWHDRRARRALHMLGCARSRFLVAPAAPVPRRATHAPCGARGVCVRVRVFNPQRNRNPSPCVRRRCDFPAVVAAQEGDDRIQTSVARMQVGGWRSVGVVAWGG